MSEVAEKRVVIVDPQRMSLREVVRQDWVVHAEAGTTMQDVLDPAYWAHMAAQMQSFDRVEVLLETGDWMLELLVINAGRNWAQVHLLHHHELAKRAETMPKSQKHEIVWKGPQLKWCVVRLADGEMIHKQLADKTAAGVWLTTYEKTTG